MVYFTKFLFSLKKYKVSVVNIPKIIKGITNPKVYIKTSKLPANVFSECDANIKTEDSAGPTHGVHAKLNVKPIM